MSKELVCPFCNKPLQPTHRIEDEYFCESYDCPQTSLTWVGTSSLWKAFADTKQKLDRAKWWLNEIVENHRYTPISTAEMALKEITALEQKDK